MKKKPIAIGYLPPGVVFYMFKTLIQLISSYGSHYNDVIMGAIASQITSPTIAPWSFHFSFMKHTLYVNECIMIIGECIQTPLIHYNDVIMGAMASQIISLTIVYSIVNSGADQRKHQSSASLAFVRGIHRWPVDSPHKGEWRAALIFTLIFAWTNGWTNNRDTGDLRRHRAHYDVTEMFSKFDTAGLCAKFQNDLTTEL